jgi:hypothetical protein
MNIYFDLLFRPEKTLSQPAIGSRLHGGVGVATLVAISALAMVWVLQIGNVPGGNPALWYVLGALLDLRFTQALSYPQRWLFLFPIKMLGDAGLIGLPGYFAMKRYGATRKQFWLWAKVYCYTLTAIDLFWLLALAPAATLGAAGRPLLVTNMITYMVCGANIVVFTNAYRCSFKLTFDQALVGWFIVGVGIPVLIFASLFLVIP